LQSLEKEKEELQKTLVTKSRETEAAIQALVNFQNEKLNDEERDRNYNNNQNEEYKEHIRDLVKKQQEQQRLILTERKHWESIQHQNLTAIKQIKFEREQAISENSCFRNKNRKEKSTTY